MIRKGAFKILFHLFCAITTALVLFIGIQGIFFARHISFNGWDLIKLISISLASTLPSLLLAGQESISRCKGIFLQSLHFILTAGAVFGLLMLYDWINAATAFYTVLVFLIIYVVAYIVIEVRARRLAKRLNERINAFHEAENEAHDD